MGAEPDNWQRRQALQIASQLPDDPEQAWAVLDVVEELIAFLFGPRPPAPGPPGGGDQAVVRFPGGPTSPKRRASETDNPSGLPK
jgi:hypothetical protein